MHGQTLLRHLRWHGSMLLGCGMAEATMCVGSEEGEAVIWCAYSTSRPADV